MSRIRSPPDCTDPIELQIYPDGFSVAALSERRLFPAMAGGQMHGYGIALHIQKVSEEVLRVEEGSLYPALHRMEQAGWISAEWKISEVNRRAKFYKLTAAGRKRLAQEETRWGQITKAVAKVLRFA